MRDSDQALRDLYPELQPFDTGTLQLDARHTMYYEQCGNPNGKPVVMLHGGPGGGCSAIFTKAGSNTITPSAPLLRSLISTSAARAPPVRTRTAAAAASIAIFLMFPFLSWNLCPGSIGLPAQQI